MLIRKSWLFMLVIFFLLSFTGCNDARDGDIVLRRPTGLACSIPTYDDGAIIRWNAVESADGYRVYIDNQEVGSTNSNWYHFEYEDSELYCGKICVIQAYDNNGGISLMSNALIIPDKAPINVQNVAFYFTVTKKLDNTMLIEWQDVKANKYEIYIGNTKIGETKELSYVLSAEEIFSYNGQNLSVRVIEEDLKVDFTPTEYTIIAPVVIEAPVITAENDYEGNFVISWKEVSGAVSYNIYIDGAQYASNITTLNYTFMDCPDYTGEEITVRAVDVYGRTSVFSNYCIYKNSLTKPQIEVSPLENQDLLVTWDKVKYAEKYKLYWRNKLVSEEYMEFETTDTTYTFSKTDLLKDAEMYEIYIEAIDQYGAISEKSNKFEWVLEIISPTVYTSYKSGLYTVFLWEVNPDIVDYEVYIDGELYAVVKTPYCEISNSILVKYTTRSITIIGVSEQGLRGEPSKGYIAK